MRAVGYEFRISAGHSSDPEGALSWSARPEVRSCTSERSSVPAHIDYQSGDRWRRHRNLMGDDEGIDGGPSYGLALAGLFGGLGLTIGLTLFIDFFGSTKQTDRTEGRRSDACVAAVFCEAPAHTPCLTGRSSDNG
jgi:hypothetical protein